MVIQGLPNPAIQRVRFDVNLQLFESKQPMNLCYADAAEVKLCCAINFTLRSFRKFLRAIDQPKKGTGIEYRHTKLLYEIAPLLRG